ncbi:DUF3224 domain-containing protein [Shewanella sp. WXL01]|uniref:DUF3224 domain-containing protein n=1 Tax=Shewanella sp. WXL01 TaxID=2709721 RepID=UPI0014385996|nr:DUF3224 domain-containing protein [Shewanella sp. WXL01]NKF49853.1 DUF3224 domain-containing protein [Shewanella sp. WXL01]
MKISGSFDVEMQPMDVDIAGTDGNHLGQNKLLKRYQGDLTAQSQGNMLSVMTPVKGSAGYVAIEKVDGTLCGRQGTFVLQHYGIMGAGGEQLILEVVPDSGTSELVGLSGSMAIHRENGQHFYDFDFEL